MKLARPSKRVMLLGLSGVLILGVVAALVYYGISIWPKQQSSTDKKDQNGIVSSGNVKANVPAPVKIETTKNSQEANKEVKMLRTYVVVNTKEQGDCTLTLSNGQQTYTAKNSSKGIENAVGCLEWNLNTEGLAKGEYDLTVEFRGATDHATVKQKVTL